MKDNYTFGDAFCEAVNMVIESSGGIYVSCYFDADGGKTLNIYPSAEEEEDANG